VGFVLGILSITAILVLWIRGQFDPGPGPSFASQVVGRPQSDQLAAIAGSTEITPTAAIQLMMMGKSGSFSLPGISSPPVVPANSASTTGTSEVIGVVVNGHARAYCVSEMQSPLSHVINDMIDGVPVTVTYCNRTDCVRVLTRPGEFHHPLDVGIGGFDGGLLLHVGAQNILQNSSEIPFMDVEFERTTWKAWTTIHPDTDVCTGLDPSQAGQRMRAGNEHSVSVSDAGE
jgi:hypothetical protein